MQTLGSRVRDVAAFHGMQETELRSLIQRDKTLWLDRQGRLFYVCEFGPPQLGPVGESTNTPPLNPLYQLNQTFKLHSRPGASRIIYLDFDGHDASTTSWGDDNVPMARPYDTDGTLFSFGNAERQAIQYIWARVAEDFLQYDVDVTTEDPGVNALKNTGSGRYGVRVVIGGAYDDWFESSAGGVANLYSFDDATDNPCWVFPKNLTDSEKSIAEACSHEAGHTLGLFHDGLTTGADYYTGHGNWAPIMGVGYDRPIVQWSRGEYSNANNSEDDLAKMLIYGAINMPDDYANSTGGAAPLTGVRPFCWGIISSSADVDYFSFTAGAGRTTITCTPAPRGPNLRIQLALYDGNGSLIISSNVADNATTGVLPVTISLILPTGNYFVSVEGIGSGSPTSTGYSDYASLGQYTLLVTMPGTGTWLPTGGGTQVWTNSANWSSGTMPLGPSATAFFNNNLTSDQTVETDMSITLGGVWVGDTDATHSFTLQAAGAAALRFAATNGNAWINKLGGLNDVITAPLQLLTNLSVTNTTAADLVLAGGVTGAFTLTKQATGRLVLAGTNNGGAGLVVAGGTLQLKDTASIAGVPALAVQAGALLDVSPFVGGWSLAAVQTLSGSGAVTGDVATVTGSRLAAGTTGAAGTLSFANQLELNNGTILDFNLSAVTNAGGGNDLIAVAGDLALSGTITVNIDFSGAQPDTNGYYTLITYGGTLAGGAINLVAANAGNRFSYAFDDSVPGEIRVQVTGAPAALVWQGGMMANLWDVGGAANWLNGGSPNAFYQGDPVFFDPTGSTTPALNLSGALAPASVTMSNTTAYTFSGTGRITGAAGLTKQGTGTWSINTSNDFSGAVQVSDGSLTVGHGSALGLTNVGTTISGTGQVNLNGFTLGFERLTLSGSGPAGDGAVVNTGVTQSNALRLVTLAGDTTIGGTTRWDIRGIPATNITAGLTGNGFALTKTGPNQIWLANLGSMLLGNITVNQGTLGFEGVNSMANSSAPLTVNSGAALAFLNAFDSDFSKVLALNSCTVQNDSGHNTLSGAGSITGTINTPVGEAAMLDLRGSIGGAGGFTKTGEGILRLAGANTFSGDVLISAGTVMAGNNAALGNATGNTTIASGARLDVAALNLGAEPVFVTGSGINSRGAIVNSLNTAQQNALRFVTLTGNTTFGGNSRWDIRANPTGSLLGAFNLTKVGKNEVWLVNLDVTQLVGLTVNEGVLGFQGTTTMGNAANSMTVSSGGTFGISATGTNILNKSLFLNFGRIYNASGSNTFAGTVNLSNSNQVDVASSSTLVLGGALGSSGLFNKVSGGTLMLAGNNTSSGASYVSAGTLQIGAGGSGGSFAATLNNNASIVFNRTADLTHSAGMFGNGTITKLNTNTLTLSGANGFTGGLTVGGGTLRAGNASALGTIAGGTTVASGATLDVNGFNLGSESVTISGVGVGGNGAVVNTGASQNNAIQFLTLADNSTIGGAARWDVRGNGGLGSLSTGGQPWSLTKTGANTIALGSVSVETALGSVAIQQGVLSIEADTTGLGNPAASVTVASGAALNLHSLVTPLNKLVVLQNGGKLSHSGPGSGGISSRVAGAVNLSSGNTYLENTTTLYALDLDGVISGLGNLNKTGAGLVQLNDLNSYAGTTIISAGTLKLGAAAGLSQTPEIAVGFGTTFDVTSLGGGFTLLLGQKLSGNGAVAGNVTANGTVAPGASVGKLTVTGNLALAGITAMELTKSGVTLTNDTVSVGGTLTLGGTLAVTHAGDPLVAGDSFHLFSAAALAGSFGNFSLPVLGAGLTWNVGGVSADGWLRVVSNTPPVIASMTAGGDGFVMSGSGGAPGAMYLVMTTTNVALPFGQWSTAATNFFSAGGNFAFTNSLSPPFSQRYFRIHVP